MRIAVVLFLIVGSAAVAGAQSLGDVAKKEEARRKALTAPPSKTYTNESLRGEPAPGTAAPAAAPAQPPAAPSPSLAQGQAPAKPDAKKAAQPEDEKKTEPYWRDRIKQARDLLSRSQVFAEALQSRINALSTDFVNRADPAQRDAIGVDRQKAIAELERVRKEITQNQKAIDDIQEEARRAGIPPGWLR